MTDKEIRNYIDLSKLDGYTTGEARRLLEAVAERYADMVDSTERSLERQKEKLEEDEQIFAMNEASATGPVTEEEVMASLVKEHFAKLASARWVVLKISHPAPKCGWCDDDGMVTLTSPDGQRTRVPCSCRHKEISTYKPEQARLEKLELMQVRLGVGFAHCWVKAEGIDPVIIDGKIPEEAHATLEMNDWKKSCAFTTRQKAIDAIKALGFELEEDNEKEEDEID